MRPTSSTPRSLCLILLGLATSLAGCTPAPTVRADTSKGAAPTRVEVVRPERRTIRRTSEQPGQIEAYESSSIYAKVSGYVAKWNVDIGTRVKKGDVLATLTVPELDAEAEQKRAVVEESEAKQAQALAEEKVAQANLVNYQAKLAESQAGIKRAEADVARWRSEFGRIEQLFKERVQTGSLLDETRSKLSSSESASEEVVAQVKTAEAAVRQGQALVEKARSDVFAATAGIKVARSDLKRVEALRSYATITAPYDSVITKRNAEVGNLTQVGNGGQPLFSLVRDDIVRIAVGVPEMAATAVDIGDRALIRLQATGGKEFEGKVSRTSWSLDARNRTLRAEIDIPNPSATLRPGLYATASIIVDERKDALILPATSIARDADKPYCLVVRDGKAIRQLLVVGISDGAWVEVVSGLDPEASVVKVNSGSLREGQTVEAVKPSASEGKK